MQSPLNPVEARVLGALIEKESTTPDYYPLSLNSLTTACNQKNNRWPVTEYTERDVLDGISELRHRGFAAEITGGSRVAKYAQRFTEKLNLGRREVAILCVLLLRGHQTLGEIKGRTERLYEFSDLEEVDIVLKKLMEMPGVATETGLLQKLPPSPGMKESRYAHTLSGAVEHVEVPAPMASSAAPSPSRLADLEAEVARLRDEVDDLRRRLDSLFN